MYLLIVAAHESWVLMSKLCTTRM